MSTILLADDNRNIREFCRRELEDEGYRVILAQDGAEATWLSRVEPVDLVILDISMPGTDGMQAAEQIKAFRPQVPVVLFTSFDDVCTRDRRVGFATACVQKQEDLGELKQVVSAALASSRRRQPYRVGLPPTLAGMFPSRQQRRPAARY